MGGPSTYIIGLIALASCQAALAGTCGQNFTSPAGLIKSPGFPLPYENNVDCDWFISPNKTSVFYITSSTFQTEECCDKVTVSVIRAKADSKYVRPEVFSGMGTLVSMAFNIETGDVVQVHFHTDGSTVAQGFRLSYTTPDECPESVFQCGGQCLAAYSLCDGIADCSDHSDETEGCLVSEDIVEGDSLQATLLYQPTQQEIWVAACSGNLCEAINLYGQSSNGQSLAYESYAQCNLLDRSCDDDSLVNLNFPSRWSSFTTTYFQFFVSIGNGSLIVGWRGASAVDATVPLTSVSGKRLFIYPLATTKWINRPTEDPSSLSTESSTNAPRSTSTLDPAYTSTTTSPAPVPTTTTPVSTTTAPTTTVTTSTTTPTPPTTPTTTTPVTTTAPSTTALTTTPTTTVTTAASTSTPTSTVTTTTSAPTRTSPGRSTVITTPQPAASTTSPAERSTTTPGTSSPAWIATSTASTTTSDPTPIWTTTGRPATPSSTTSSPGFPTPPTPPPGWPPVPAPPACPLDLPLRFQYLLVPVEGQPQLYVICFAGWGQSMMCPQPLAFSYAQQKCVWSWNASLAAIANKS